MKEKKDTKKIGAAQELLGPAEHIIGPTHDTLLTEPTSPKAE